MDDFRIIYKMLKYLREALDYEEPDIEQISHERLRITYSRWEQLWIMLQTKGYVEGIICTQSHADAMPHIAQPIHPRITLDGLEYLSENNMMRKIQRELKGLKDMIPGI